ncbi:MAG: polymer-forming cytoskeletal protein [Chloroflexota bacterium]|nr:polymer-forming cytoskeletal protein [Chloroflexota bacterium]
MNGLYEPTTRSEMDEVDEVGEATVSESRIDQYSHFDGTYTTAQDLHIEGTLEGEIRCEGTVTVAEGASVNATVQARHVILAGSAEGTIECGERFLIQPSGEMRGRVRAASLVVEEGAFFEGEFRMATGEADTPFEEWAEENVEDRPATTELEAQDDTGERRR